MFFWTGAAQVAAKMETMRSAEAQLVEFARRFGERDPGTYNMELLDTEIPSSVLPLKKQPPHDLVMHGIRVTNSDLTDSNRRTSTPLVLLHGYMNGTFVERCWEVFIPRQCTYHFVNSLSSSRCTLLLSQPCRFYTLL